MSTSPSPASPSFSQSSEALSKILDRFRGDNLTLEDALSLFEEGVQHLKICQSQLTTSRGRVEELVRSIKDDGRVSTKPFPSEFNDDEDEEEESYHSHGYDDDEDDDDGENLAPELNRYRVLFEAIVPAERVDVAAIKTFLNNTAAIQGWESVQETSMLQRPPLMTHPQTATLVSTLIAPEGTITFQAWVEHKLISAFITSSSPIEDDALIQLLEETFDAQTIQSTGF